VHATLALSLESAFPHIRLTTSSQRSHEDGRADLVPILWVKMLKCQRLNKLPMKLFQELKEWGIKETGGGVN
jgi:hypothetical protein